MSKLHRVLKKGRRSVCILLLFCVCIASTVSVANASTVVIPVVTDALAQLLTLLGITAEVAKPGRSDPIMDRWTATVGPPEDLVINGKTYKFQGGEYQLSGSYVTEVNALLSKDALLAQALEDINNGTTPLTYGAFGEIYQQLVRTKNLEADQVNEADRNRIDAEVLSNAQVIERFKYENWTFEMQNAYDSGYTNYAMYNSNYIFLSKAPLQVIRNVVYGDWSIYFQSDDWHVFMYMGDSVGWMEVTSVPIINPNSALLLRYSNVDWFFRNPGLANDLGFFGEFPYVLGHDAVVSYPAPAIPIDSVPSKVMDTPDAVIPFPGTLDDFVNVAVSPDGTIDEDWVRSIVGDMVITDNPPIDKPEDKNFPLVARYH